MKTEYPRTRKQYPKPASKYGELIGIDPRTGYKLYKSFLQLTIVRA